MNNPLGATRSTATTQAPNYMNIPVTTSQSQQSQIASKLVAIMKDITAIGKDSRNQAQGFSFRGIDAVYNELHSLLAKHGVVCLPEAGTPVTEERTNKNGTILRFVQLPMRYNFIAEDGSTITCSVIGEGMDSGDKATNKAMAIAHKYALLQTFLIPTEEQKDPDYEAHEVKPRQSVQKPVIKPEKAKETIVAELVEASMKAAEEQNPLTTLSSLMWDAGIEDSHVIEFLIAKKAIKDRSVRLKEVNPKVIARLIEKFDDVLAFKPAL